MPLFEDIDKTETTVFNAAQWIGCGRVYKDVPHYVCDMLTSLRKIPDTEYKTYIPSPHISVEAFINLNLPAQSAEIITTRPSDCFSKSPPDEHTYKLLTTRSIPLKEFLDKLENMTGQARFDGNVSIKDPRFNGGRDNLPMSALTYWQQMSKVISMQLKWRRAKEWVRREAGRAKARGFPALDGIFTTYG